MTRRTMMGATLCAAAPLTAQTSKVPKGFKRIFNGKDLSGWHISDVNHHGKTRTWRVENGTLSGHQDPPGEGGILLTDQKFKNFEVAVDVMPDWGCDGGLFLRASEKGEAYQVLLDYLEGGNIGGIYGERLTGVKTFPSQGWEQVWKKGAWNSVRARITGDVPKITVWLNEKLVTQFEDTENHAAGGATEGMIAVQVHRGTNRWTEGGKHRFRNIAVKVL